MGVWGWRWCRWGESGRLSGGGCGCGGAGDSWVGCWVLGVGCWVLVGGGLEKTGRWRNKSRKRGVCMNMI